MAELLRGFGRGLTALFFGAVLLWGVLLIVLPQLAMLDASLRTPLRQLDSAIAGQVARDAATCRTILERRAQADAAPATTGGLAVPSIGMAVPSVGMAAPGGGGTPFILQCERATLRQELVRDDVVAQVWLDETYGVAPIGVDTAAPVAVQLSQADAVRAAAQALEARLIEEEAARSPYGLGNFQTLLRAQAIPLSEAQRAIEEGEVGNRLLGLVGLRYVEGGQVYQYIALTTLARTILYAMASTALALLLCYPVAYRVALASRPERAVWLLLALIVPYAVIELVRIYAWVTIIETNGLLNEALRWIGALGPGEAVPFKRYPLTVFTVMVYTYILFMAFPLMNVMGTLDRAQIEAARDLGASPWRVHRRIVIPHAKPGIAVGCIATFMLCAGAFSVPRIVSRGLQSEWFAQTIYNKFFESGNEEVGAAYAFAFIALCFAIVALFMALMRARLKDFATR